MEATSVIIQVNRANLPALECFASETRIQIVELLAEDPMNIKKLAEALRISSAIVTKHIQKLESAGIVATYYSPAVRGRQKLCRLSADTITLQLRQPVRPDKHGYTVSIPVGQYSDFKINPTCGLASERGTIGIVDDPRYFAAPEHVQARIVWFGSGYVEYRIPNYLVGRERMRRLTISFEICSEAPGYDANWPSDIHFSLNDVPLGSWTCPGEFGSVQGSYTPVWWIHGTQHGLLKTLILSEEGCYLDGVRISDVSLQALSIGVGDEIRFRIANPESAAYVGGVTLFGRGFGNYDQDIEVMISSTSGH